MSRHVAARVTFALYLAVTLARSCRGLPIHVYTTMCVHVVALLWAVGCCCRSTSRSASPLLPPRTPVPSRPYCISRTARRACVFLFFFRTELTRPQGAAEETEIVGLVKSSQAKPKVWGVRIRGQGKTHRERERKAGHDFVRRSSAVPEEATSLGGR